MSGNKRSRRSFLATIGAAGASIGAVDTVAAGSRYREYAVTGMAKNGSVNIDYTIKFNTTDVRTRKIESWGEDIYTEYGEWVCEGSLVAGGTDIFEIPNDAAITEMQVQGGNRAGVTVDIDSRGYGEQVLLFAGDENPGWAKMKYSAMSNGDFSRESRTEWGDRPQCSNRGGFCSLVGQIKGGHYDRWRLEGDSLSNLSLMTKDKGGDLKMYVTDQVSPR